MGGEGVGGGTVSGGERPKGTQGHWMEGWDGKSVSRRFLACLNSPVECALIRAVLSERVCRALVQKFTLRSSGGWGTITYMISLPPSFLLCHSFFLTFSPRRPEQTSDVRTSSRKRMKDALY